MTVQRKTFRSRAGFSVARAALATVGEFARLAANRRADRAGNAACHELSFTGLSGVKSAKKSYAELSLLFRQNAAYSIDGNLSSMV